MNWADKAYWWLKNRVDFISRSLNRRRTGLLDHRDDLSDLIMDFNAKPRQDKKVSLDRGYRFDQKRLNICVFASRVQGISTQTGTEYSVRWDVKVAKKLGLITGKGWSHLRAENHIGRHIGRVPKAYMDDEIGDMSFKEYSKWTVEDDQLLKHIAPLHKNKGYYRILSTDQAKLALQQGYILFTATKWSVDMDFVETPFHVKHGGMHMCDHAFMVSGYDGDWWETTQTFGNGYGEKGKMWLDDIFKHYPIYIEVI